MLELVAQGPDSQNCVRHKLPAEGMLRVGRAPRHGLAVAWDTLISREHVDLVVEGGLVRVQQLESAKNVVLFRGRPVREFEITSGDEFVIGRTVFRLNIAAGEADLVKARTISRAESEAASYAAPHERLELLSRLPDLLADSDSIEHLAKRLVDLLLAGIPAAEAAAVVQLPSDSRPDGVVFNRARVPGQEFSPSRNLLREALAEQQTRLHLWTREAGELFTFSRGLDWAFCTPIRSKARTDWALYIAGRNERFDQTGAETLEQSLLPDVRFSELLARFLGSIYDLRNTERQRATLSHFFSPAVMEMIAASSEDQLQPRSQPITTMFCDLRGFSRMSEQAADLSELLAAVSQALGLMTREIIRLDGVIADFQGDSVLSFWGWPLHEAHGPAAACRAALAIQAAFRRARGLPGGHFEGFRIGIGVAHGVALAGKIGTSEQSKVGVFGPVVNLGSRLEGLTSAWGEVILVNDDTVKAARDYFPKHEGEFRRLGKFRLYGMKQPVVIHELQSLSGETPRLSPVQLRQFTAGATALFDGDWASAAHQLTPLADLDGPSRTMLEFLASHPNGPPADWDGAMPIGFKRVAQS